MRISQKINLNEITMQWNLCWLEVIETTFKTRTQFHKINSEIDDIFPMTPVIYSELNETKPVKSWWTFGKIQSHFQHLKFNNGTSCYQNKTHNFVQLEINLSQVCRTKINNLKWYMLLACHYWMYLCIITIFGWQVKTVC